MTKTAGQSATNTNTNMHADDVSTALEIRQIVRNAYTSAANSETESCGSNPTGAALALGYSEDDLAGVAGEANMGIGCGNPHAIANISEGEVVLDLGSGAGFDAMIAAPRLGENGRFIGVDMTPEMLARARRNAVKAGVERNVEFREGLIEDLPVSAGSVDVVISNCVINLSPEKERVFSEIHRVLKPGGRIAISDIVLSHPLPPGLAKSDVGWVACVSGALVEEDYFTMLRNVGFVDLEHQRTNAAALFDACSTDPLAKSLIAELEPETLRAVIASVFSYSISARKK